MSDLVTRLERALALARLLPEHVANAAEIGQENDGDVTFDWWFGVRGYTLGASANRDGSVSWACLAGSHRDHATMPLEQAASAITSNYNLAASIVPNAAARVPVEGPQ